MWSARHLGKKGTGFDRHLYLATECHGLGRLGFNVQGMGITMQEAGQTRTETTQNNSIDTSAPGHIYIDGGMMPTPT
jgi:hypothetical protein